MTAAAVATVVGDGGAVDRTEGRAVEEGRDVSADVGRLLVEGTAGR